MFAHLHGHSQFSLLEAIGSSKAIIARLKELGFSHAPLLDYNGMYNAITHYEICKKEEMKPLIGVDLAIQVLTQGKSVTQSLYISLITKNYDGYLTLLQTVSLAQTLPGHTTPWLSLNEFPPTENNIIALINCYNTPLGFMMANNRSDSDLEQLIYTYKEHFGADNVYLEVIPQDPKHNKDLADHNKKLYELHKTTNTPIIVSSNFHYIYDTDKEAYDIARCIKDGKRIYDDDRRKTIGDFHIASHEEIIDKCLANGFSEEEAEKMMNTTLLVADKIDIKIPLHDLLFPVYESPEYIKDLYQEFLEK